MVPHIKSSQTTTISLMLSAPNSFSSGEAWIFGLSVACLSFFTVASNAVVIHLARKSSELKPLGPLRWLLGSMAWGDLLLGLVIMPLSGQYSILEEWIFGEVGCMLFMCILILCGASTALHLTAIAIDRYLAVMHPLMYRSFGSGYTMLSISITWVLAIAIMMPTALLKWFDFWNEDNGTHQCDFPPNDMMALLMASLVLGVPYCTIWGIYIRLYCMNRKWLRERISKTLKTHQDISRIVNNPNNIEIDLKSDSDARNNEAIGCMPQLSVALRNNFQGARICLGCNAKIPVSKIKSGLCQVCRSPNNLLAAATRSRIKILMKMTRKTLFVTLIVTCTFTVCYVPLGVQYQVATFCPTCETNARLTTTILWIAFGMSALNPIIYGVFNMNFRRAFKKLINN